MANILLVRHGQASFGADNYDQLSPLGYQQTQLLGEFLKSKQWQLDGAITGTMARQIQSYHSFCQGFGSELKQQQMVDFNEFDHEQVLLVGCHCANKAELAQKLMSHPQPMAALYDLFTQAVARWQSGDFDGDYAESWQVFQKRAYHALQAAIAVADAHGKNANIVVFTSGGVISCIVGELLGLADAKIFELNFVLANAAVSQVRHGARGVQVMSVNEFSYLQTPAQDLISWH